MSIWHLGVFVPGKYVLNVLGVLFRGNSEFHVDFLCFTFFIDFDYKNMQKSYYFDYARDSRVSGFGATLLALTKYYNIKKGIIKIQSEIPNFIAKQS